MIVRRLSGRAFSAAQSSSAFATLFAAGMSIALAGPVLAMESFAPGTVSVRSAADDSAKPVHAATPAPKGSRIAIPDHLGFVAVSSEQGPRWMSLTVAQRDALGPLEEDWPGIDASRKQKWLDLAARYPSMSVAERQRVQERMADWARLTPTQRGETRANFQQATRVLPQDRQAQWEAYQALPDAERSRLASQAAAVAASSRAGTAAGSAASSTSRPAGTTPLAAQGSANAAPAAAGSTSATGSGRETVSRPVANATPKSNIVPNPTFATTIRSVSPAVVRAGPGATTTLITKQPLPPVHQQPGLPKIAATPTLVDQATLLPQRGPQAAQGTPTISGDGAPNE